MPCEKSGLAAELEDRRIAFRIGINVGYILIEDGDILGDGANVASRPNDLTAYDYFLLGKELKATFTNIDQGIEH
jgi:class 3 adenylate cyclase